MSNRNGLRIGIVGAGAIGGRICRALDSGEVPGAALAGLCEVDEAKRRSVLDGLQHPPPSSATPAELAAACDLVVEAVSPGFAPEVIEAAVTHGADVVVMSVAGLVGRDDLVELAARHGRRIYVPTGAIAGLDAVRAAAVAGLDEVTLTTTKPPAGLAGAPHVVEHGLDLAAYREPTVIFDGSAREAVAAFPKNVNVSAALSLAGLGVDRTRVRVVVDPTADTNRHEITATGAAGRLTLAVDNVPSPDNPKTSYLAALSAIALLRRLTSSLVVGS
ncbi:MAG: aspartate dehydrogenase [Armatimonadetes bacterium]|nr:aspartate dehydrogenase [Armatimonadota bacterium]